MQVFIALEEMNGCNGALCVVPKSHHSMQLPNINYESLENEIILDLKPGDIVIFDSRMWHRTRSEKNSKGAWSILLTYRCWWLKQQFDLFALTKKFHSLLSDNQKLILGGCSIPSVDIFSTSSMRRGYDFLKE